jgi:hypothetical protein
MTNPLRDKVETLDGDQWVVGIEPSTIRRTEPIHLLAVFIEAEVHDGDQATSKVDYVEALAH